jgi:hypothetical protein
LHYDRVKYLSQRVTLLRRKASHMNGAEALVASAISGGVEICFANPGTYGAALGNGSGFGARPAQHPLPA